MMNGNTPWNKSKSFLRRVEADPLGPFANVLRLITSGLPLPLREGLFFSKTEILSFQLLLWRGDGEENVYTTKALSFMMRMFRSWE